MPPRLNRADSGYDPECEVLARYFLDDTPGVPMSLAPVLALAIQRAIEDWLNDNEEVKREPLA